jgi:hypothetical protein
VKPTGPSEVTDSVPAATLGRMREGWREGYAVAASSKERVVVGPDPRSCAHEMLMPRWRGPQAMGDEARAMGYVCHRCHAELTPFAARELRAMRPLAPAREKAL